jgi:hypothetical protein
VTVARKARGEVSRLVLHRGRRRVGAVGVWWRRVGVVGVWWRRIRAGDALEKGGERRERAGVDLRPWSSTTFIGWREGRRKLSFFFCRSTFNRWMLS